MISAMRVKSGTIIDTGRNMAFRLSGNSERPAYPGFMVTKIPQAELRRISCPKKLKRVLRSLMAYNTYTADVNTSGCVAAVLPGSMVSSEMAAVQNRRHDKLLQ